MEYVEIIDENGHFTGQILDVEKAHLESLLHPAVIVIIMNKQKQILLSKRSKTEAIDGNKWALIGGHVAAGETQKQAAVREIAEEIGIKVLEEELKEIGNKEINQEKNNAHVIYFYYVKKDFAISACQVQKEEISAVRWFEIDKIIKAIKNNNQNIINKPNRLYLLEMRNYSD